MLVIILSLLALHPLPFPMNQEVSKSLKEGSLVLRDHVENLNAIFLQGTFPSHGGLQLYPQLDTSIHMHKGRH